jgi:hypothetical protein
MELSEAVAAKVLNAVDAGLTSGMGIQEPGKMCVEAAVCFALGLPHGDNPPCVGEAVRSAKIRLNDSRWSSDAARAKGMRRVAIAQLGSDTLDQREFAERLATEVIRQIVPIAMRAAASLQKDETHKAALEGAAKQCETTPTEASARSAKKIAADAADAADAAYAASLAAAAAAAAADAAAADAEKKSKVRDEILSQCRGNHGRHLAGHEVSGMRVAAFDGGRMKPYSGKSLPWKSRSLKVCTNRFQKRSRTKNRTT